MNTKKDIVDFRCRATEVLGSLRPNATFLSVHHYMNNFGEVSDFSICFHVNYAKAIARAKTLLEQFNPETFDFYRKHFAIHHLRQAQKELLESYDETLSGERNSRDTSSHAYDLVRGQDGKPIPGIKIHRNQDVIHLWGFGLHKRILMPGNYGPDRRMPLTIAKDELRYLSPLGNFRQFHLEKNRFHKLVVDKITIREEDVIRERMDKMMRKF